MNSEQLEKFLRMAFAIGTESHEKAVGANLEQFIRDVIQTQEESITKLQADIMNIPTDVEHFSRDERLRYKAGHRDARHAAVDLILEWKK